MALFRILLLDEEPAIAEILGKALEQQFPQANLIHCTSLTGAVAYLNDSITRCQVNLVIVDVDLHAEHTGLDLIEVLRQHQSCQLAPILALSSQPDSSQIEDAYKRGVNAYTEKPYSYAEWKRYAGLLRSYWYETVTMPSETGRRKKNP